MINIILSLILLNSYSFAKFSIDDLKSLKDSSQMPFREHIDEDEKSFANALALNVAYEPILKIRKYIENKKNIKLKFLQAWDEKGEAHVTTITPPEYVNALRFGKITMKRIHEIAKVNKIQSADLKILALGSGRNEIDGKLEETFFIIVDSTKLREIRYLIYEEYIKNGGNPKLFDPTWFFPHITIGYTLRDLHEPDVIKNIKYSIDPEFEELNSIFLDLNNVKNKEN